MSDQRDVIKASVKIDYRVTVELKENEVRALDALACYGDEAFLKVFYKHLGISYMQPFEKDLISLFEKIRQMRPELKELDKFRELHGLPKRKKGYS